ncbi:MAG: tRNA 2-thiouridine(34) synthase MnmA [Acidimicrobiia bacterium]
MQIAVMMSGGVDSSVAAGMLAEQGHDVAGITLKLWGGESDSGCCSIADVDDARRVAAQLGIPHYVFNLTDEFNEQVVQPYVDAYEAGETPNPCVECNRSIKWGPALERVRQLGFDVMATGHHAQIRETAAGRVIARSPDHAKDQSYVLAVLTADQLASTMLPLGTVTKDVVRERAHAWGLRTASKSDSQDVCFITKGNRVAFLGERIPLTPGAITDLDGVVLGEHDGIPSVTIGQRRGLNIASGDRQYVVDIDATSNTVTLGSKQDLLVEEVRTTPWQWMAEVLAPGAEVEVQVRAHGATIPARITGGGAEFLVPAQRVAPGQLVVVYRDDCVLGSATAIR